MGIFNRKKKKTEQPETRSSENQSLIKEYYGDSFSNLVRLYARSIYEIPEVRIAIQTIAEIVSTVPIYHKIEKKDGTAKYIDDDISEVLALKPNPLQNSNQFWTTVVTQLLLNSNVFIEPIYDNHGRLRKLFPLPVHNFEFILDKNGAYVQFYDTPNGNFLERYNMEDLIYFNRFAKLNGGQSNDIGLYETVVQSLEHQILKITDPRKVKAFLQGSPGQTSNLKPKDAKGNMEEFKTRLDDNVEGVAYIDPFWKVTNVNWQENDVNRDLMAFVINVVYNYFKITDAIIQHKATEFERESFIADSVKPLIQQFEQELTYKLFSAEERRAGHKIEFDIFALSVSTLQAKNAIFQTSARNGILCPDEMREMIGQPALPDGKGQRFAVSADCVNIDVADEYQIGKVANNLVSTEKSDDIENKKKEESGQDGES